MKLSDLKLTNCTLHIEWFPNNDMKLHEDKCHLLISGAKDNELSINTGGASLKESKEENLLGIRSDRSLSFKQHGRTLFKIAS